MQLTTASVGKYVFRTFFGPASSVGKVEHLFLLANVGR